MGVFKQQGIKVRKNIVNLRIAKKKEILIILLCIAGIIISVWKGYYSGHAERLDKLLKINIWYLLQPALFGILFAHIHILISREVNNIAGLQIAMGSWLVPLSCCILLYAVFTGIDLLPSAEQNNDSEVSVRWFDKTFYLARLILYPVIWLFLLAKLFFKNKIRQPLQRYSAVSLIIVVVSFHLFCHDWFSGAEPGWHSTLFEWYMLSAMLAVGSAMFILLGLFKEKSDGPFFNELQLTDWAKYLFAFSLLWGYMWYFQYMIIWQTAYQNETIFYTKRLVSMPYMQYVVFILCFFIPLLFLLSRKMKTNLAILKFTSFSVLIGHWLELYYIFNIRLIPADWYNLLFDVLLPVCILVLSISIMKKHFNRILMKKSVILVTLGLFMVIASCTNREKTGKIYYPDMFYSSYQPVMAIEKYIIDSMKTDFPLPGSIAAHYILHRYPKDNEGRTAAGLYYTYSGSVSQDDMKTGKELYEIYCSMCHGSKGDGKGYLYVTGKYATPPRSLLTERVQDVPAGEIYHVIVRGFNLMQALGGEIPVDDRWKIVLYIKSLPDSLR